MPTTARTCGWLTLLLLAAWARMTAEAATVGDPAEGCRTVGTDLVTLPITTDATAFPPPQLQIRTPLAPAPFPSAGRSYLIYELHLQNLSDAPMNIRGLEVLVADRSATTPVAAFQRETLRSLLTTFGNEAAPGEKGDGVRLAAGSAAIAFLCLAFEKDSLVPQGLTHRVALDNGTVDGTRVDVAQGPLRVLAPPVSGVDWIVANGPSNTSHHRRGLIVMDGTARISRRFAIDWKRMKNDAAFTGDARDVRAYHAYGQSVLAVADATVVSTMDGLPDNVPRTATGFSPAVPVMMDNIGGNHVVLDLGSGQFAYYAHLQAGTIGVKKGDRVRRGQVLGRIGNSGDAREPHLHFQLTDAMHILAAEGLPHVIDRYLLRTDTDVQERTGELPVRGMSIDIEPIDSK
ncbi:MULTISPECIES: M23 family metallopeptidase [unclassified Lysobacter]|uniref:M23 family metallopeptidase n=1 Tax=unclassified Lysobacter TaxID=2635362 RepID=UPI001BE6676E|nr:MULTISPECIES: M23 family metallopeptidase [unclassified Lysobacter]MBT2750041.1 M23 family metallopeptidase [Lysobacter sp. ISL-50]MBT2775387.1 M23 family metallopeptidase [Lysobacter sp. ISL-54]MBT2783510.1 M23 family metallopeptidase [Lysobacter sp. ISL-52]